MKGMIPVSSQSELSSRSDDGQSRFTHANLGKRAALNGPRTEHLFWLRRKQWGAGMEQFGNKENGTRTLELVKHPNIHHI
jgi:hypothetical protein